MLRFIAASGIVYTKHIFDNFSKLSWRLIGASTRRYAGIHARDIRAHGERKWHGNVGGGDHDEDDELILEVSLRPIFSPREYKRLP